MEINCRIKINNKINVTYAGSNDYSHFFTSQELTVKEKETQTTQSSQANNLEKYRTRRDTYLTVTPRGYVLKEYRFGNIISVMVKLIS